MPGRSGEMQWEVTLQLDLDSPGPHWREAEWRQTVGRAETYWTDGLRSDFAHVWSGDALPYARGIAPVEKLAEELVAWRDANALTLLDTQYAAVKLKVFQVTLWGIWDEQLAVIDVLGEHIEWYGERMNY